MHNIDFQDMKMLMKLKNDFQLMNEYVSIKLTSTFINFYNSFPVSISEIV